MTSQPKTITNEHGELCLLANQCKQCGQWHFPTVDSCLRCQSTELAEAPLSNTGTLWSWTSQNYMPKTPPFADTALIEEFTPFLLGYIEFAEGIRVIGRLQNVTQEQLEIDMKMQVRPLNCTHNQTKETIHAYCFEPIVAEVSQ